MFISLQSTAGVDLQFLAENRREEIRNEESSDGAGALSVAVRVKYEGMKAEVDELVLRILQKQARMQ